MSRLTVRWRVTLAAVAVLALALVVASVVANVLLSNGLRRDSENVLRNRAAAEAALLNLEDGKVTVGDSPADGQLDRHVWVFAGGRELVSSAAPPAVSQAVRSMASVEHETTRDVGESVRVLARPVASDGGRPLGTVVVGAPLGPYEHSEAVARSITFALVIFTLLAAAISVYWAVGRALHPVDRMTRLAADWSEHDLHRRFDLGPPRDEVLALAATLDTLLGRIDAAMRREQRVTAEIAHELRTPLAALKAEAELRLTSADEDEAEALRRIVNGADRMNAAIETLLAAHHGDGSGEVFCDPADAARAAVEGFRDARPDRSWVIEAAHGESRVEVGSGLLVQTLAPLLENAARHADERILIDVTRSGNRVVIGVTDDGGGLPAAQQDGRQGNSLATTREGLGLPLTRRLAQSFGAELAIANSDGGTRFELRMDGRPAL